MKFFHTFVIILISMTAVSAQDMTPAEIVDTQLEAYNARDIDAFIATYAEDAECYEYGQSYPFVQGRASLKLSYGALFQRSPNLYARSTNRIVQGDRVIDHEVAEGINGGELIQVVVIYEIGGGLIKKVTFIY